MYSSVFGRVFFSPPCGVVWLISLVLFNLKADTLLLVPRDQWDLVVDIDIFLVDEGLRHITKSHGRDEALSLCVNEFAYAYSWVDYDTLRCYVHVSPIPERSSTLPADGLLLSLTNSAKEVCFYPCVYQEVKV
jgi:hypothetical protein